MKREELRRVKYKSRVEFVSRKGKLTNEQEAIYIKRYDQDEDKIKKELSKLGINEEDYKTIKPQPVYKHGYFHGWFEYKRIGNLGIETLVCALVENEDGTMDHVGVKDIVFVNEEVIYRESINILNEIKEIKENVAKFEAEGNNELAINEALKLKQINSKLENIISK